MAIEEKKRIANYWMMVEEMDRQRLQVANESILPSVTNPLFNIWDMNCPLSWKKRVWENYTDYATATHLSSHTSQIRFQHHIVLTYSPIYSNLNIPIVVDHAKQFMSEFARSCGKSRKTKTKINYMCVIESDHDVARLSEPNYKTKHNDLHIHILTTNTSGFTKQQMRKMIGDSWKADRSVKQGRGYFDFTKLRNDEHRIATVWYLHKTFGEEMSFERFSVQRLPKTTNMITQSLTTAIE